MDLVPIDSKYLSFKQVKAALHHVDRVSMVIPLIDNANHVIQDVAHAQTEPRPPLVQLAQMIDTEKETSVS